MRMAWVCALVLSLGGQAGAEGRAMTLAADARLDESGLLAHLVPRFSLKTGVRVTVLPGIGAAGADALLAPADAIRAIAAKAPQPVFRAEGQGDPFAVLVIENSPNAEHAERFADWLRSEIGQRTVAQFTSPTGVRYTPGTGAPETREAPLPEGNADRGEALALLHCGRCHVVSERNRFAGIGSTPSFAALRAIPGWLEKFQGFWRENPHPAFTQVEGVTDPFDPARPPHIAPVELTPEEVQAIVAYAVSLTPKDLGAAVEAR